MTIFALLQQPHKRTYVFCILNLSFFLFLFYPVFDRCVECIAVLRDTLFKNQHRTTKQLKRCTFLIMNFCRKFVQNGYPKVTKKWENPHLFTAPHKSFYIGVRNLEQIAFLCGIIIIIIIIIRNSLMNFKEKKKLKNAISISSQVWVKQKTCHFTIGIQIDWKKKHTQFRKF